MSPIAKEIKAKINKWDDTKVEASAHQRKSSTKGNLPKGRRYLQIMYLLRGYYTKNSYNSIAKKVNNLINKRGDLNTHFLKKTYRWSTGTQKDTLHNQSL